MEFRIKEFVLKQSPKVYDWRNSQECEALTFDSYNLVESCLPDAVFYWYVSGSYEGSGALIAVMNGKWCSKDLDHCSCYGPLDGFARGEDKYTYESLNELLAQGTEDWQKEYAPLVELARNNGY